ncbi:MAG: S-layer homology domain-containing protein, partial [Clostridiales Family XIII bacterium]|nr:S-layer homology domain-containing protein [Clostridiales Family XIII bacterium]
KANGIVNGVGGNSFAPDRNVSRQDFAVILVRYSEFAKTKLPSTRQPVTFADETQIAGYAKNAVRTLYAGAIINGVGQNTFSPAASATRAEVAAMLHRFVEATK